MDIFFKGQILFPVIMVELQNFCSARQRRWRLYIKENLGIITKVCCSKPKSVDEVSLMGELCTGKVLRKNSFWKKFPAFTEAKNDSTWTHWPGSGCLTLFLLWGGTWGLWLCPYPHPAVAAELGLFSGEKLSRIWPAERYLHLPLGPCCESLVNDHRTGQISPTPVCCLWCNQA